MRRMSTARRCRDMRRGVALTSGDDPFCMPGVSSEMSAGTVGMGSREPCIRPVEGGRRGVRSETPTTPAD